VLPSLNAILEVVSGVLLMQTNIFIAINLEVAEQIVVYATNCKYSSKILQAKF